MSTAELEAEVVETPEVEQDQAPEDALPEEHEIARAESEGLPPSDMPEEAEAEPEKPAPVTSGIEWEMQQIIEVNAAVLDQRGVVEEKADDLKQEKKELERLQDQLNALISRIAAHRRESEPDPKKFPLFDREAEPRSDSTHAEVNGMFPKPEAIQPGMPSTLEAFQAIRARDTTLESLKLGKRTLDKLRDQGVTTVQHLQSRDGTAIGLTLKQMQELDAVMEAFDNAVLDAWHEANPAPPEAEAGATLGDSVSGAPSDADEEGGAE